GASLDAQRAALTAEAAQRGWDLELVADEGLSAKNLNRPALTAALDRLDNGQADTLLSLRLDRISRSVADFAGLMVRAQRRGWGLVLLSPALDLADPAGRFTANVLASAAEYERELIGARTREGMAQRRAEGVHLGRPSTLPTASVDRIRELRATGLSLAKTAAALTAEGVPTAAGGQWYPSTIKAIEDRQSHSHGP
ncbi:recombinase family protein, partial [Nakamurella flavida]|uniref:recombinase family protein n=1 Tax=Nakamurella flavida TaxID=363630 RepID=UPI0031DD5349